MRSQSMGLSAGWQVFAYGNSITAGTGTNGPYTPYWVQMRSLVDAKCKTVWGYGIPGNTTEQLVSAWASSVLSHIARANVLSICILWEVTNAIASDAATSAAQAFSQLGDLTALARAAGGKVICPNVIARTNFTTQQRQVATEFNTLLASDWASICDATVDLATTLHDSTDLANYDADGTHLNNTGQGVVASLLAPAVLSMIP